VLTGLKLHIIVVVLHFFEKIFGNIKIIMYLCRRARGNNCSKGIMAKYNITELKEKEAHYRTLVSPALMDEMKDKILNLIVMQKKYKDKNYSAKRLAEDLGTNTRYVSAVVNVRFHMNYTSFVNKFRIEEAMAILVDRRYQDLRIEEVSDMVGFSNRQSFYASFYRILGMTPRAYRQQQMEQHPNAHSKKEKKKA